MSHVDTYMSGTLALSSGLRVQSLLCVLHLLPTWASLPLWESQAGIETLST
jgi:hypothetical protein